MQRITCGDAVGFGETQWLPPHQVDKRYTKMIPTVLTEITAEEEAELVRIFGKNGELRAERVN